MQLAHLKIKQKNSASFLKHFHKQNDCIRNFRTKKHVSVENMNLFNCMAYSFK
jgi:hypothetical protein